MDISSIPFVPVRPASVGWRDRSIAKTEAGKFAGWAFKPSARRAVWTIIRTYYPGEIIETQQGRKVIPELDGGAND